MQSARLVDAAVVGPNAAKAQVVLRYYLALELPGRARSVDNEFVALSCMRVRRALVALVDVMLRVRHWLRRRTLLLLRRLSDLLGYSMRGASERGDLIATAPADVARRQGRRPRTGR